MASLGDDLLVTVNKLQDLVFNTIGNDSLDLPQIVCLPMIQTRLLLILTRIITNRSLSVRNPRESPRSWKTLSAATFFHEAAELSHEDL